MEILLQIIQLEMFTVFVIAPNITKVKEGSLNNIAPTVLKLMGLDIPKEMDEPLI